MEQRTGSRELIGSPLALIQIGFVRTRSFRSGTISDLCHQLPNDMPVNVGEPEITTLVGDGQKLVVDPHQP